MSEEIPYQGSFALCRLLWQASLTGKVTDREENSHLWLQVLQTELC